MSGDFGAGGPRSTDATAPLPRRLVRLRRTSAGIELYFPPLRCPEVAIPLALFGALAFALPALGAGALLPSALASTAGAMTAVLVGVFIAPFAVFGAVLVIQALYMLAHSLRVEVGRHGITSAVFVLGVPLPARHLARADVAVIVPRILTRHQSVFTTQPIYQLVASNADHTRGVTVAASLRGEALMLQVKTVIEETLGIAPTPPADSNATPQASRRASVDRTK
jgi:hypothetical protein